jgi:hypothetical protein
VRKSHILVFLKVDEAGWEREEDDLSAEMRSFKGVALGSGAMARNVCKGGRGVEEKLPDFF